MTDTAARGPDAASADLDRASSGAPVPGPPRPGRAARGWAESWRGLTVALVGLVSFLVIWFADTTVAERMGEGRFTVVVLLDAALGLALLVLVPFRRHAPLAVALVAVALAGVSTLGVGAAVLAYASLATRRRAGEIGVVSAVFVASTVLGDRFVTQTDPQTPLWQVVVAAVLVAALIVAVGLYVGGRRELLRSLRERARLAEGEQALRLAQARDHERTRIAREMHDVLAHRLSLVALHAGALEYRDDLDPDAIRSTAGVIRENARTALTELREVLGVLREPEGDAAAVPPQPTLDELPALVADARTAGADVVVAVDDSAGRWLEALPTSVSRHAYRVVQECLTNARRHAPGQPVTVAVSGRPGRELRVRVENPLAGGTAEAPSEGSAGHGLTGLAERARLAGGSLRVEVVEGRHAVEARFPWAR